MHVFKFTINLMEVYADQIHHHLSTLILIKYSRIVVDYQKIKETVSAFGIYQIQADLSNWLKLHAFGG
jgi:hypothetical protein